MNEVAFIVKEDSELYNNYITEKIEKEKCWELLKEFIKNSMGEEIVDKYIVLGRDLILSLTEKGHKLFQDSVKKDKLEQCYKFKINSQINKLWNKVFDKNIIKENLNANSLWYWDYMNKGIYSMFDYNGKVYGYLNGYCKLKEDDMTEIKMSEYYKIVEEMKDK